MELVRIVLTDLHFLRDEWDQNVTDDSLRRSSIVLRRLIVEGDLQRAWKIAGFTKEPIIRAVSLEKQLRRFPRDRIKIASAGGARVGNVSAAGFLHLSPAPTPEEMNSFSPSKPQEDNFPLRSFAESPALIVSSTEISRHVIIKYVCNKLGGAHYDAKRGQGKDDRAFLQLDRLAGSVGIAGKDTIYFELLSIGQAMLKSVDIEQLMGIALST